MIRCYNLYMTEFINAFVGPEGMNRMLIYFLLLIPFIALIGTISRHFVGIKTLSLGVFLSIVYIVAFLVKDNSLYSVAAGLILILFIYFFSYIVKKFTIETGMHYYARISFVLTIVSITVLLVFLAIYQIDYVRQNINYNLINPFAVVLAVALAEQFSSHQIQKGIKTSRTMFINTLMLACITGFIASLNWTESFILSFPYLIFVALVLSYYIGKYQGMRLIELIRFQTVAKSDISERE